VFQRKLKRYLPGHDCLTVPEAGFAGKRNGELLALAEQEGFDVSPWTPVSNTNKIWQTARLPFSSSIPRQADLRTLRIVLQRY
jgi:hypothetical protein